MKVIAINGSPRKDGNTYFVLKTMAETLANEGIEVEILQIGDKLIHGCIGCAYCRKSENNMCVFNDDIVNEVSQKLRQCDGIILGSPTYYGGIAGAMKALLDRVFYSGSKYFLGKVGTAVAVARRAGAVETANQLSSYLRLSQVVLAPSQYWLALYGAGKGEVAQDLEGIQTAKKNAAAMAWLLKNTQASKGDLPQTLSEQKVMTNFIR